MGKNESVTEKSFVCHLDPKLKNILEENPHCIQYFCSMDKIREKEDIDSKEKLNENGLKLEYSYKKELWESELDYYIDEENIPNEFKQKETFTYLDEIEDLIDLEEFNELKNNEISEEIYAKNTGCRPDTVLHLGQLKLFLSTLQFLLYYCPKEEDVEEVHVIYPGSAPGNNILFLIDLFPNTYWYLIDPNSFHKSLSSHPRILLLQNTLFTDSIAKELKNILRNEYILFISDIRITAEEEDIHRDNILQKKWVEIMKPNYAQLKWRLPRLPKYENYNYFDGDTFLQMFQKIGSKELRLVVDGKKLKYTTWNYHKINDIMYVFNRKLRPSYYTCRVKNEYTDHCHDCVSMINLLTDYKKEYPENIFSKNSVSNMITIMLEKIPTVKNRFITFYNVLRKEIKID